MEQYVDQEAFENDRVETTPDKWHVNFFMPGGTKRS